MIPGNNPVGEVFSRDSATDGTPVSRLKPLPHRKRSGYFTRCIRAQGLLRDAPSTSRRSRYVLLRSKRSYRGSCSDIFRACCCAKGKGYSHDRTESREGPHASVPDPCRRSCRAICRDTLWKGPRLSDETSCILISNHISAGQPKNISRLSFRRFEV